MLPTCCCTPDGPTSCKGDTGQCGSQPTIVEMEKGDAEILCGEWHTGRREGEDYNVVLPLEEIIRHPDFDATKGAAEGSDIAVFKVSSGSLTFSKDLKIYPACLPKKDRNRPTEGFHAGWSKPPPRDAFTDVPSIYDDFFKQWHYKMDVFEKCKDPTETLAFGAQIKYPSNSYYPPGTVCARDFMADSCFSTGDSGAPLMVKDSSDDRLYVEGLLSFVKGCEIRVGDSVLHENPVTYTKLSCFLPWVAEQYGLSYDGDPSTDESCRTGQGSRTINKACRVIKGFTGPNAYVSEDEEKECIFPFYFKGKRYDQCILIDSLQLGATFLYPSFMCPRKSITTKIDGINSYDELFYCKEAVQSDPVDPSVCTGGTGYDSEKSNFENTPFYTCKNDCPGGNLLQ